MTTAEQTRRLRIDLAYDGSGFAGWARQPGLRTVQGELEGWLGRLLGGPADTVCAGRTDAGVHARGQVVHVDAPAGIDPADLRHRLSRTLPPDLVVRAVTVADPGFDARFAAIWRRYCYRLVPVDAVPDPLLRGHCVRLSDRIDLDLLSEACSLLVGLRDFAPFCRRREGATTIRTLQSFEAREAAGTLGAQIEMWLQADAFCHSMVRSLTGAVLAVAAGRRPLSWLVEVADADHRANDVQVMAAQGLTLEQVGYPPADQLAARAAESRRMRATDEITTGEDQR